MSMKWMLFLGYLATVPAANWTVANVGTVCVPDGPCLIPVGWGLTAPSGVLWIGLALCLRDGVHEALGRRWALLAVLLGSALSFAVSPPFVAVASSVAFLVSEVADTLVYGRLRERGLVWALIASNLVGLTIDSAAFLWIAFGSLDFIAGQLWAKAVMTGLAAMVIVAWKGYRINSEIAAWDRG
jgi:uncharacterized PurR-regulated membrane protein YhhQ (DUF165 family)